MKILMFTKYALPHIGGVEIHIHKVSNLLVERGHQVTVITSNKGEVPSDTKYTLIQDYYEAYKTSGDYDIVHCHDFEQYIPGCYMTFHGYEGHVPPDPRIVKIRQDICLRAKGCMFVGEYVKEWYKCGARNEQVMFGGVDPYPTYKERTINNRVKISYVGRVAMDKRTDIYIEALQEFNIDFGCYESIPNNEIRDIWLKTDIAFANGQLSMLEAMSVGTPVIAVASNPMVASMLTECPPAIVVSNKEEVVEEIEKLLADKNYYSLKSETSWKFANQNTWDNIVDKYEKLWRLK